MARKMILMLICLGVLFGAIFGYQIFKSMMMKKYMLKSAQPPVTVSTTKASNQNWQPNIKAVGSLRAVKGVDVTTEIAGLIRSISFAPGTDVKEGAVLLNLNDDAEKAQLHVLIASSEIANTTYERDKAQYAIQAVSKQTLDNDAATLKGALAQVEQQKATVAKKTIQAPFSGRIGICNVNLGQYLNPGDKIATLQSLDPIYVDFYLPQQSIQQIKKGQTVTITSDTFPSKTFTGKITTIDPKVDPATRNIQVEATVSNPKFLLLPGMFATVDVITGKPIANLTLPKTAISFNPYGEIAYIVKEGEKDKTGKPTLIAHQTFVKVGEARGDQIVIMSGIKEGDTVVTSGQLKLKNGSPVVVNNKVVPRDNPAPKLINE